jgi:RNA polymerase sigma-70 factor (ECF subfamily)
MALSSEEHALIARAVKRDPEAFANLYVQFYDAVLRRVAPIVKDPRDAEDLTAETFLRAWNAINRFQDRDVSIVAWFCIIAERLAYKHLKRTYPKIPIDEIVLAAPDDSNPEDAAVRASRLTDLKSALSELPTIQREVLSGRYLDDLSYNELGRATGRPVGTVRVIHHRALKAIRGILSGKELPETQPLGPRVIRPAKVTK